ncbi:hypothetical protein DVR12_02845 [Chitinophaga silvatica]|uniref:Uncharacterized protein n=1 Tax=Chitinophaga silvatica TaxID=2282649 RepID=A0A3E1YH77_9BACT|nr:hypothetical protein [Chitinophaga silvatica]RFS26739.1 hypothetical protein DVR12_02845 [Chitinophaga silvatica]
MVFLIAVWFCQLSGRYLVMLNFYLNQDYIAQNLCENRDKPQMHCNGKCHLAKKLNEEDKKDRENPERKMENKNELFNAPVFAIINLSINNYSNTEIDFNSPRSIGYPIDQPSAVFRPPIA